MTPLNAESSDLTLSLVLTGELTVSTVDMGGDSLFVPFMLTGMLSASITPVYTTPTRIIRTTSEWYPTPTLVDGRPTYDGDGTPNEPVVTYNTQTRNFDNGENGFYTYNGGDGVGTWGYPSLSLDPDFAYSAPYSLMTEWLSGIGGYPITYWYFNTQGPITGYDVTISGKVYVPSGSPDILITISDGLFSNHPVINTITAKDQWVTFNHVIPGSMFVYAGTNDYYGDVINFEPASPNTAGFFWLDDWSISVPITPTTYVDNPSGDPGAGDTNLTGRGYSPTSRTIREWGSYQIVATLPGGTPTDVTMFRDVPAILDSYSYQQPYGESAAQITFPQITEFDQYGTGELDWLRIGANIDINRVLPTGETKPLWCGFITSLEASYGTDGGGMTVQCAGALSGEAALRVLPVTFVVDYEKRSIGKRLQRVLSNTVEPGQSLRPYSWRFTYNPYNFADSYAPSPPIDVAKNGSRSQTVLDYMDELMALAQDDYSRIWTIARKRETDGTYVARNYEPQPKGGLGYAQYYQRCPSRLYTIDSGARGVTVQLSCDIADQVNAVYGEGIDGDTGERWRNAKYPNVQETIPLFSTYATSGSLGYDFNYYGDNSEERQEDYFVWRAEALSDGYQVGLPGYPLTSIYWSSADIDAAKAIQARAGLPQSGYVDLATWNATFSNGSQNNATLLTSAYFAPIVARTEVEPYLYTPNGSIAGINDNYDPAVMRVERMTSFGEGISKARAVDSVEREFSVLGPTAQQHWTGTITLEMDPREGSRLDIVEGDFIKLRNGITGDRWLMVAGITVAPESEKLTVTLTIDTMYRDLLTVAEVIERNRETRFDPARNIINQRRKSAHVAEISGWDGESGAGKIPAVTLSAGWNVIRIVLAQYGQIEFLDVKTYSPAKRFVMALFGKAPSNSASQLKSQLGTVIGNPLNKFYTGGKAYDPFQKNVTVSSISGITKTQQWLDTNWFIEAWGTPDKPGGYWPGDAGENHPLTGRLRDESSFAFATYQPPFAYLAVYVEAACSFKGVPAYKRGGVGMLVTINE